MTVPANTQHLGEHDLTTLRAFVTETALPAVARAEAAGEFPVELYRQLHAMGWLPAFLPESMGGSGLGTGDMCRVARTLAYASSGLLTSSLINMLAISPILLHGSDALREATVGRYAREFSFWSFAMTEPDAGFDVVHTRTRARRVEGGYRLTGQKCFITNATVAEHITVYAVLEGASDPKRAGVLLYVPGNAEGLSRGKRLDKMGQHCSDTSELFFDEVFVPEAHRIGEEGHGLGYALHGVQRSKTVISAGAVGVCDRVGDLAVAHLAGRKRATGPLLEMPQLQTVLAHWQTRKEAAWGLVEKAAAAWDGGAPALLEASMAKMFASDTTVGFCNDAIELFGGYGYTSEHEISRIYRDSKLLEIYEGSTTVQQALISRELFGRTLSSLRKAARTVEAA